MTHIAVGGRTSLRGMVLKGVHLIGRLVVACYAFVSLGYRQAISYPLVFVITQLSSLLPIFIWFFVAKLIDRPGAGFGDDYFTSVVIGLIGIRLLDAGLRGFGQQIDMAINRGWMEMFLVEPVRWRFLPFAMSLWPGIQALVGTVAMVLVAVLMGAHFRPEGFAIGSLIVLLGMGAGMAIGTLSAAVKVLAKSGDPLLLLYSLAAQFLSGVYFSIDDLPGLVRWMAYLLPHTYVIQALRAVLVPSLENQPMATTSTQIWVLVIFTVVAFPVATWVFGRALEYGRKLGVLSGY